MEIKPYWIQFMPINENWYVLLSIVYSLIGLFGLSFNFLVMFYLIKVKKKRTPSTLLIINLSTADIMRVVLDMPMVLISAFNKKWIYGQLGCDFYVLSSGLQGFTTIYTLMIMSVERYIIVKYPLYSLNINKRLILGCIILTWISSLLIILPQIYSTNGFFLEGFLVSCTFDYFSRDLKSRLLLFYMVIFGFMIPIVVIVLSYIKLYSLVKIKKLSEYPLQRNYILCSNLKTLHETNKIEKEEKEKENHFYKIYKENLDNKKNINIKIERKIDKSAFKNYKRFKHRRGALKTNSILIEKPKDFLLEREIKVAKVILIKVCFFCAAWTPYVIVILLTQFGSNIEKYITPKTTSLPSLFAKSSIIFNALIYTLTQKECSSYYYKLFKTKKNQNDIRSTHLEGKKRNRKSENSNDDLENSALKV